MCFASGDTAEFVSEVQHGRNSPEGSHAAVAELVYALGVGPRRLRVRVPSAAIWIILLVDVNIGHEKSVRSTACAGTFLPCE